MTATNHALTGALIGLTVATPWALPLAFASHFLLDAIPHYTDERIKISSKGFANYLILEALLCFSLVCLLALRRPEYWLLAAACAFLAASPDFMWVRRFVGARQGRPEKKSRNPILRFHSWIQWFAKPIGAYVEIVWCAGMLLLLLQFLSS